MLIVDAHEDLAWNVLTFGRDYTRSASEIRHHERETRSPAPQHNGDTLLGWDDYQQGQVGIVFGTLFAAPARKSMGTWDHFTYQNPEEAHRKYMSMLDVYHQWTDEHPDKFKLIQTQQHLADVLSPWEREPLSKPPVGLVVLMEGAEGVREPAELEAWWGRGVRIIGPAWVGTRFCGGTGEPGPLTRDGYALLEAMDAFGFTLDVSHMDARAALQSLDVYQGQIIASHANAKTVLKGSSSNRHLTDDIIRGLIERNGVIGVVPYNRFLQHGWTRSDGKEAVGLDALIAQIDYICQMAGNANHVGIGSDFDGGLGWQHVPRELNTIADLQKIPALLYEKGYDEGDVTAIMGGNWIAMLEHTLPETV